MIQSTLKGVGDLRLKLFVLGWLLISSVAAQAAPWKKFAPKDGGFSILLPGTPKEERKVHKDPDGTTTTDQDYTLETSDRLYMIGYQEHDATVAKLINASALLDEMVKTVAKEAGGTLRKQSKITLNGFAGREVVATIAGSGTIRFRVFWTGRRLYTAMAAFPNSPGGLRDAARFLGSMTLAKKS